MCPAALQDLHAAYAAQLSSQCQHEQAAAHYLAAGRWSTGAKALCARGSAAAAAAAVQLCRRALSGSVGEQSGGQQQLEAAQQLLEERAAAEGLDAAALLAAAEPAGPALAGDAAATPAGGGQARQRYTAQQLLALGHATPSGGDASLQELPDDLSKAAADPVPAPDPAVFGRSGPERRRYTLQALLQLCEGGGGGGAVAAAMREALPEELLPVPDVA